MQVGSSSSNSYQQTKIGAEYYDESGDAQQRSAYYAGLDDSFQQATPDELFEKLHKLLAGSHKPLSELPAEVLYAKVDRRPDGALYYLYSGQGPKEEEQVQERNGRDLQSFNLEHVVPKDWFDAQLPMRDDLHHLFTEQRQCNSDRGDLPLREVQGNVEELEFGRRQLTHGKAFEPNGGKGEAARAIMYFVTRYPGLVGDRKGELTAADLSTLLKWHKTYPVSDYERHRNEVIQAEQGTRNPFIDFPELADKVDLSLGFGGRR
jgi:hypothetical protein